MSLKNMLQELKENSPKDTKVLNTIFFTNKDIPRLIEKISNENGDNVLVDNLKRNQLKCEICKKNISNNFKDFGGIIKNKRGKWIILCNDLYCYNKSL